MTEPYYHDDTVTLYHGDCRTILPDLDLSRVDLCLTDPPYGISLDTGYRTRGRQRLAKTYDYPAIHGDDAPFDPSHLLQFPKVVLWGANYYADRLPAQSGWLVWDKRTVNDKGVNDQADGEMAWTNCVKGVRIYRHLWNGFWRDSEMDEHHYPAQKPVALMRWAITRTGASGVVVDPYMGSGPVVLAARDLGLSAIGIEVEERYLEIVVRRLAQLPLRLGDSPPQPERML